MAFNLPPPLMAEFYLTIHVSWGLPLSFQPWADFLDDKNPDVPIAQITILQERESHPLPPLSDWTQSHPLCTLLQNTDVLAGAFNSNSKQCLLAGHIKPVAGIFMTTLWTGNCT